MVRLTLRINIPSTLIVCLFAMQVSAQDSVTVSFLSQISQINNAMKTADSLIDFDSLLHPPETISIEKRVKEHTGKLDTYLNELDEIPLIQLPQPTFRMVARVPAWQPGKRYELQFNKITDRISETFKAVMPEFQQLVHAEPVYTTIDSLKGEQFRRTLFTPIDHFEYEKLTARIETNKQMLRRYEKKYGPNSPRLNLIEVLANYGIQRCVPGFKPTLDGPSPLELIAAYSTTYYTVYDCRQELMFLNRELMSLFEVGLRYYIFNEGWGAGTLKDLIKPGYISGGLALGSMDRGFLKNPFRGDEMRIGAFLSYGKAKIAWLHSPSRSLVMVSRQFQILPWVF